MKGDFFKKGKDSSRLPDARAELGVTSMPGNIAFTRCLAVAAFLLVSGCASSDQKIARTAARYGLHEPIYNSQVETFEGGALNRYIVKNFDIENQGNRLLRNKGGRLRASLDIFHHCPECRGALSQIIVGLAGEENAQSCIWSGMRSTKGWLRVHFELTIPDAPGIYYIRTRYAQAYDCENSLGWWQIDRPGGPTEESNIGFVVIR